MNSLFFYAWNKSVRSVISLGKFVWPPWCNSTFLNHVFTPQSRLTLYTRRFTGPRGEHFSLVPFIGRLHVGTSEPLTTSNTCNGTVLTFTSKGVVPSTNVLLSNERSVYDPFSERYGRFNKDRLRKTSLLRLTFRLGLGWTVH